MSKVTYTPQQLQAKANEASGVFASNPKVNTFFATEDGQFFTYAGDAKAHTSFSKHSQEPVKVNRAELSVVKAEEPAKTKTETAPPAGDNGATKPDAPRDYAAEFKGKFADLKKFAAERGVDLTVNTKAAQIIAALEAQDAAAKATPPADDTQTPPVV